MSEYSNGKVCKNTPFELELYQDRKTIRNFIFRETIQHISSFSSLPSLSVAEKKLRTKLKYKIWLRVP